MADQVGLARVGSKPKRQHWVPRFYLRYFATPETRDSDEPQVWIFSKNEFDADGEPKLTNISKVAAGTYLYSPKDAHGERDWGMEEKLADLEDLFADLWPDIAGDFVELGSESIRKALALFVATTYLRNPKSERAVANTHARFVELYEQAPKDADGNPLVEVEYRGKVRRLDGSGYAEYRNPRRDNIRRMFVDSIRTNTGHVVKTLLAKRWSILFSEEPVFVTTDAPVDFFHQTRKTCGFGTPGVHISVPLSPTRILFLDDMHHEPANQYYALGEHGPPPFNIGA